MSGRDGHKEARQYSDQMHCTWCSRTWDTNDPDPPPCEPYLEEPELIKPKLKYATVEQFDKLLQDLKNGKSNK